MKITPRIPGRESPSPALRPVIACHSKFDAVRQKKDSACFTYFTYEGNTHCTYIGKDKRKADSLEKPNEKANLKH